MMWMRLWACSSKGFYLVDIPKAPLVRAFLTDAYESIGCGEGAAGGAFCVRWGLALAGAWALVPLAGAMFLVLDGALVEGQANGVNAIAKIRRGIETLTSKHVA